MFAIEDKIKSWSAERKAVGKRVYERAVKHVDAALLSAYSTLDPSLTEVPPATLTAERKKFGFVANGDFSREYFAAQEQVINDVSSRVDFVDYLLAGYAPYAIGLVNGLARETRWMGQAQREQMMGSLINSIFSECAVVVYFYISQMNKVAETERNTAETERLRVAAEDKIIFDTLTKALAALAGGDLTYRIDGAVPQKSEDLKSNFNESMNRLQGAIREVSASTTSIRSGSMEIASASDDLSRRTEQQAASLEETAAALNEITATVKNTATSAQEARVAVMNAKQDAEHSGEIMQQAEQAMSGIESSSRQISQIIGVIDEIAFQTNLLALNAGVEAARAGEAGKGFAVVAQEVRELAQRSANAAKEIKALISTSEQQVGQGVNLVAETGKALERIVSRVSDINGIVSNIAASANEQASGIDQVNVAINQMDQFTQQNAAMVEESTASSHTLRREAEELEKLVGQFRVGGQAGAERYSEARSVTAHHRAA